METSLCQVPVNIILQNCHQHPVKVSALGLMQWNLPIVRSCWQDNFKCDKVRVIVAWGKNCREESDKGFAIGYQVCKGTCRVLTVIQLT